MAWYLKIDVIQEPGDGGLDVSGRPTVKFNIMAEKVHSDTFVEEVVKILVTAGVGTFVGQNRNIFVSSAASIPDGAGPYLSIHETGGTAADKTHNDGAKYRHPALQITTRARDWVDARRMAARAHSALINISNQTLTA
jgi:hypothetical protein